MRFGCTCRMRPEHRLNTIKLGLKIQDENAVNSIARKRPTKTLGSLVRVQPRLPCFRSEQQRKSSTLPGGAGGTRSTGIADLAWRDYNLRKTSQDFHTERTEKEKPLPRVDHESRHLANDQKANLTPSCTRRPSRLAIYCPKRAFTCLPVASNRATVSTLVPVPFAPPN